jgi:nicotinic acid mononucleotide adenylyltransferase
VAFVVVSRPGLSLKALVKRCDQKIREAVRPCPQPSRHRGKQRRRISAAPPAIYLVEDLKIDISSTVIRARIAAGKPVDRLLVAAVADYIRKNGLYR